jgi:hypothetical protein
MIRTIFEGKKRTSTEAVDRVPGGDLASSNGANADETAERMADGHI